MPDIDYTDWIDDDFVEALASHLEAEANKAARYGQYDHASFLVSCATFVRRSWEDLNQEPKQ